MRPIVCILLVLAALAGSAGDAAALRSHHRDGWVVGLSYGGARGELVLVDGSQGETEDGVSPQIRFGRMISRHFALGVSYSGWLYETGVTPLKFRFSMQNVGAALTWYPGQPDRGLGGLYVRGGVGLAWTSLTGILILAEEEQGHGARLTESGVGVEFNLGYEFRLADNFAAGMGVGFQQLSIEGDVFDQATFYPVTFNLGWYF
ncbi:MAG: porin family protein [bacterium]|nr:porin family protein [bacterium]